MDRPRKEWTLWPVDAAPNTLKHCKLEENSTLFTLKTSHIYFSLRHNLNQHLQQD